LADFFPCQSLGGCIGLRFHGILKDFFMTKKS